ncbi:MAG: NCS2 family permease [Saccharofermentanales bacterium]|jgi:AGZA family xanthine/uracil permease-like MFS transporter
MFEKWFKLKEHGTTVKTEMAAGLTTFMTMAYILAVNPQILGATGMDAGGVLIATAISSAIACVAMAFMSNLPFALAPGMGINAFFAYEVVLNMGYSWQFALFAVFIEGIIFIILSLTNVREAIFNSIPMSLKNAVGAAIGLFIAFIGLQNGKLVQGDPATLVAMTPFKGNMQTSGMFALLTLIGVIIMAALAFKKVKGAVLIGMIIAWILGMLLQLVGAYVPNPELGFFSLYPTWSAPHFEGFGKIFGQAFSAAAFENFNAADFFIVMFSFLFVDIFDTLGTLVGVSSKANMLDENGQLPKIRGALMADSIGTVAGAICGTSTVTTYVESSAGIAEGGRTGLTALTTGVLFLLAIVLSPIFISIPSYATAAALIYVGFLMMTAILKVDFSDLTEAIPAYICLIAMPFFYSISAGIMFGIIFYVVINMIAGKFKKISPLMYVLAVLFILKLALLG